MDAISMAAISVEGASVFFHNPGGGGVYALADVSLEIAEGAFVVVLGASGCGKTTLLRLIAGFLAPSEGDIRQNGHAIAGPSAERGVVFQGDTLFPWLNVRDNVAFGQQLKGISRRQRRANADLLLDLVGLDGFGDHRIWQLSGGMRHRVGLARALNAEPDILLMDEPFAALDALTREEMQQFLLEIWGRTKKTMLLITHSIEEAVFLATRLIVMSPRPGRIIETLDLDFGRRCIAGEWARTLKAEPAFIAARERVAARIFSRGEA
jgi:taurine transport system ATP-binding protein